MPARGPGFGNLDREATMRFGRSWNFFKGKSWNWSGSWSFGTRQEEEAEAAEPRKERPPAEGFAGAKHSGEAEPGREGGMGTGK
jgi:hypothetical protein